MEIIFKNDNIPQGLESYFKPSYHFKYELIEIDRQKDYDPYNPRDAFGPWKEVKPILKEIDDSTNEEKIIYEGTPVKLQGCSHERFFISSECYRQMFDFLIQRYLR